MRYHYAIVEECAVYCTVNTAYKPLKIFVIYRVRLNANDIIIIDACALRVVGFNQPKAFEVVNVACEECPRVGPHVLIFALGRKAVTIIAVQFYCFPSLLRAVLRAVRLLPGRRH